MTELEAEPKAQVQFKNLICNFRAPDLEHYQLWQRFKEWCKDNGEDVCKVTLGQVEAFMVAVKAAAGSSGSKPIVTSKGQVIIINEQNTFVYRLRSRGGRLST